MYIFLLFMIICIFTHRVVVFMTATQIDLTDLFPMHPFLTPWKHQKTVRFSDVFRGYRKDALGTNRLIKSDLRFCNNSNPSPSVLELC